MGNVGDLLRGLYDIVGDLLPAWAWAAIGLVVVAALVPALRTNAATDAARKAFARAQRERGEARERAEAQALGRVRGNPHGLVALADLALAAGRDGVAREALAQLAQTRRLPADVLRLQRLVDGPQPATALEAAIVVERLLAQGQVALARERLDRALARWPGDEDLRALADRAPVDDS